MQRVRGEPQDIRPFHALIDVGDPDGVHTRATLEAWSLSDAHGRFQARYKGRVVILWFGEKPPRCRRR